jgi:hypothetical protein
VRINEELLERKIRGSGQKTEINSHGGTAALTTLHPSVHKSWYQNSATSGGRSISILRLRTESHRGFFLLDYIICRKIKNNKGMGKLQVGRNMLREGGVWK